MTDASSNRVQTCPMCDGEGRKLPNWRTCPECDGEGTVDAIPNSAAGWRDTDPRDPRNDRPRRLTPDATRNRVRFEGLLKAWRETAEQVDPTIAHVLTDCAAQVEELLDG